MQNFDLLRELGKVDRPVLLKRGLSSTIEEWLAAAEYVVAQGNQQVILCERGIRTFESATRNTLDLSAVVVVRERSHLPIIVDPSHGTGSRPYVAPMAWAARAAGAHGLLIEVHPEPDKALSDSDQSLSPTEFAEPDAAPGQRPPVAAPRQGAAARGPPASAWGEEQDSGPPGTPQDRRHGTNPATPSCPCRLRRPHCRKRQLPGGPCLAPRPRRVPSNRGIGRAGIPGSWGPSGWTAGLQSPQARPVFRFVTRAAA